MKNALITGSGGLIGSEAVRFYIDKGFNVYGIDNNMRSYFFGDKSSVDWNIEKLKNTYPNYFHHNIDIRNKDNINKLFNEINFDLIIHAAAQPSHDWAANEPHTDFSINTEGTLNLLEAFRLWNSEAVFIFLSTNKVYGDSPNKLPLVENENRYEIRKENKFYQGIDESMSIDQSKHSLFGCSKLAADIFVQEYGRYFNLKTCVFRGGCLTGPAHSSAKLHGFLSYLAKCVYSGTKYTILGYKGKQVRDNIHSFDLITAIDSVFKNPKLGEVYNIGGSRHSNISILEAISKFEQIFEKKANFEFSKQNRSGDHIWYISDISKFRYDYPEWKYEYTLDKLLLDIANELIKNESSN